jgi:hypothetical protein
VAASLSRPEVVPVTECQMMMCARSADLFISHPGRPDEGETPLCADHAATALEEIEGAEVTADAG